MDCEEVTAASEVYKILIQKGLVDREGAFVWDKSPTKGIQAEATTFWAEEQTEHRSFAQKMDEEEDKVFQLPKDIMPDFGGEPKKGRGNSPKAGAIKKQRKWGPVEPVRYSNRIDRSKNILEKAVERKQMTNLEKPKRGMIHQNPFHAISSDTLDSVSNAISIIIDADSTSLDCDVDVFNSKIPSKSPHNVEVLEEDSDRWIEVIRKSRGKHPRKSHK